MEVKVEVKTDNTFVYNIVAKCIAPFDESPLDFLNLFYFLFNSHLIFNYRYTLFFNRYLLLLNTNRANLTNLLFESSCKHENE